MSSYDDSLVGYTATSNTINSKDLVLNGWSIYGSNGVRTLTLKKDEDNTKVSSILHQTVAAVQLSVYINLQNKRHNISLI